MYSLLLMLTLIYTHFNVEVTTSLCKKIPLPVSGKTEMPADINYDMKFG